MALRFLKRMGGLSVILLSFGRRWTSAIMISASMMAVHPANAEEIRTRASQEHINAFQKDCRAKDVPAASCTCMVTKLAASREGDAALDVLGLMSYIVDDAKRHPAMLALLNRHGMRASELQAIVKPGNTLLPDIAKQCG